MTVLVGMLCDGGIVIGADSSMTFSSSGFRTIEQRSSKISVINEHIVLAATGSVGLAQRFANVVEVAYGNKKFTGNAVEVAKYISSEAIKDFHSTFIDIRNIGLGALLGFVVGGKPYLVEYEVNSFQPEFKNNNLWYVSMGSGQCIADPFLGLMRRVFCPDKPPDLPTGKFITAWCLQHTIDVNPGGVNGPLEMATLVPGEKGKYQVKVVEDEELDEHKQFIEEAEQHLSEFTRVLNGTSESPSPPNM